MAKKKKSNAPETEADIMYDGIPGADKVTDEDVKPFEVDMNFEEAPEEDVTEDESEEIEESEPTADTEEAEEAEAEEAETEVVEAESDTEEDPGQETVLESDEGDTQQLEGGDAEATDEAAPVADKEPMIPKSRFDEVLSKQKALQRQLDELKNPTPDKIENAPEFNFDEKEAEYQDHILNGKTEEASKVRAEMRDAEKQQMLFEMQNMAGKTVEQSAETVQLQAKAEEIAEKHPALNETSSSFDEVKAQEVIDLRDAFMVQGHAPAVALDKAANYVMGDAPAVASVPDPVNAKIKEKKKVANTTKKIEAAESQPPTMKGKNKTEKKVDLDVLSNEEFDALPAETLRRMRGDFG